MLLPGTGRVDAVSGAPGPAHVERDFTNFSTNFEDGDDESIG
jgi:hypothetical protein